MVNDRDIWSSAYLLVKQYGDYASIHAAMQVDKLTSAGDLAGSRVWQSILCAIERLIGPPSNETVQ